MLIQQKNLVKSIDWFKSTILHWAAKRGYTEMVKIGINSGALLDEVDILGRTPLLIAKEYK